MLRHVKSSIFEALSKSKDFSRDMFRTVVREDLEKMSKEDLIKKVLNLQSLCGQLKHQNLEKESEYNKMMRGTGKRKKKEKGIKEKQYRYIAIKLAYLGWNYQGLQSNANLDDSIENILRGALRKTQLVHPDDPIKFSKCGRTDKGVSSFDQVMTLCVNSKLQGVGGVMSVQEALECLNKTDRKADDENTEVAKVCESTEESEDVDLNNIEYDYPGILNRVLPAELRILGWAPLKDFTFSARFNCSSREYRYYFPRGKLDIGLMSKAAQSLCGLHDYRNFCKINVANCTTYIRRIHTFEIIPCENNREGCSYDLYYAKINGSGFLHHQVRFMMTVLFLVGLKLEQVEVIKTLLDVEQTAGKPNFGLANEIPLVLFKTKFDTDLKWRVSADGFSRTLTHLQAYWSDLTTKAQMTKELIESIQDEESDVAVVQTSSCKLVKDEVATNCAKFSQQLDELSTTHGVNKFLIDDNHPRDSNRYKPVMERPRGKRLEEHFEHLSNKKARKEESSSD